ALKKHSSTFTYLHVFIINNGVQRRCMVEFGTPPPTRVTITRIRDKFLDDGSVQSERFKSIWVRYSQSNILTTNQILLLFQTLKTYYVCPYFNPHAKEGL
ncbi:hypothetical protein L9F63_025275, partial [Diploptera punctata]